MKNRLPYVDYAKAIAMILVVMGHVNFANGNIKAWIYSFHMPAFFFCSGLVLNVGVISLKDTLKNKIKRLVLPYFLWAFFYASFSVPNFLKILYGSSASIVSCGSLSSLWFLPVMFISLVLFYLFVKTGYANRLIIKCFTVILAFVLGSLLPHFQIGYPWGTDVAITAFAFLLLGNISQEPLSRIIQYFKAHLSMGIFISILLCLLMFTLTFTYQLNSTSGGYAIMKNAQYGNYGMFVLTAQFGIFMLLYLSIMIELLSKNGYRWLSFIGQNTLVLFVVHKPIIGCFNIAFRHVPASDLVALIITTFLTLVISCGICSIINKYAPILAGK